MFMKAVFFRILLEQLLKHEILYIELCFMAIRVVG